MTYHCLNCGKEMEFRAMYCSAACRDAFSRDGAGSHNDLADRSVTTGCHTYETPADMITGGHCVVCGVAFEGYHRRSKRTCGAACRKKLSRYGSRIDDTFLRVLDALEFFNQARTIPEFETAATDCLEVISEQLEGLLTNVKETQKERT